MYWLLEVARDGVSGLKASMKPSSHLPWPRETTAGLLLSSELLSLPVFKVPPSTFSTTRQITVPNLTRLPITNIRWQLTVWMVLATRRRLIVPVRALRHRRCHRTRVTAIQIRSRNGSRHRCGCPVLNVPNVAEILSPPPRPVANRKDCAVVVVVWVVPLASDARTGSCGGRIRTTHAHPT